MPSKFNAVWIESAWRLTHQQRAASRLTRLSHLLLGTTAMKSARKCGPVGNPWRSIQMLVADGLPTNCRAHCIAVELHEGALQRG